MRCGAAEEMKASPGQNYYTTEETGEILLRLPAEQKGRFLYVRLAREDGILPWQRVLNAGDVAAVPVPLKGLLPGVHKLEGFIETDRCRLVARVATEITILPPKPNAVKIDNFTGGLIVDGLPFLPFGFYSYDAQPPLPDIEVVNGFRHFSPCL